ncbi:MAG: MerR family transcriptional regulator [Candidatus Latescibacterota bacterium]
MAKSNIRGPYTMLELSQITRLSIETLRHYQQIGVIPIERAWDERTPQEVFYKVDVDRIRAAEANVKAKEEETAPSGPAKTELARKMNRLINVHAREYPQLSRTDLLDVLHRTYVKHLNPSGNDA